MNQSILFTGNVIETIKSLPLNERVAVSCALLSELILGKSVRNDELSPSQTRIFDTLRNNVMQDSMSLSN